MLRVRGKRASEMKVWPDSFAPFFHRVCVCRHCSCISPHTVPEASLNLRFCFLPVLMCVLSLNSHQGELCWILWGV